MRQLRLFAAAVLLSMLPSGRADVRGCVCDAGRPETMEQRECSLCRAAEAQPSEPVYFLLRDTNPRKPNRWLALPRFHGANPQDLRGMKPEERAAYWKFTMAKAHELWGDSWGLAINSLAQRTQCHMHIHIGKLGEGAEDDQFVVVAGAEDIPLPKEGDGLWVHPAGGKLHVHSGNETPELLLLR